MTSGTRVVHALTGIRRWLQSVQPRRADLKADVVAGLPGAISSVPDGMAASVLAGISPVHGLYASFAGPIAGGLTSSSRLMVITTTSAAALAVGSALEATPADQRAGAAILLTIIAGLVLAAAALLGVGRFVRFVSHSVMLGFLTGIGVNIVLSQIPDLLGVSASGGVALTKAFDALTHPSEIDLATLAIGVIALAILVLLGRTRLAAFSSLIALVVPTALLVAVRATSVARVSDAGAIPAGLDRCCPTCPHSAPACSSAPSRSPRSSWSRERVSRSRRRTRTGHALGPARTSWRRAPRTSPRARSAGSQWAARSARPP